MGRRGLMTAAVLLHSKIIYHLSIKYGYPPSTPFRHCYFSHYEKLQARTLYIADDTYKFIANPLALPVDKLVCEVVEQSQLPAAHA